MQKAYQGQLYVTPLPVECTEIDLNDGIVKTYKSVII